MSSKGNTWLNGIGEKTGPIAGIDTGKIKRDILTMYESADIETVLSLMGQVQNPVYICRSD